MTVKELSGLYYLRKLLIREQERVDAINSRLRSVGTNYSGMPHADSTDVHKLEDAVADLIRAKDNVERKRSEYRKEQARLEEYINSVEDPRMRYILSLRFIDLLSWRQIARKVGGGNTEDGVRISVKRFLQKK